jgi:protein-tyrosine phosphatase
MLDLHSHILPGLDDGPESIEGTFALARAAVASGTTVMVATPHIDHNWNLDPRVLAPAVERVRADLQLAGIELDVVGGAEVSLARLMELDEEEYSLVRLGEGPYILLECPHGPEDPGFPDRVFEVLIRGEALMLAHPERCPLFQNEPDRLRHLVEAGLLASITAGSLLGRFGRVARKLSLELLAQGLVHAVVSDAHNTDRRPPGLAEALAEADHAMPGLASQTEWLTVGAPRAILTGEPLPPRPALPPAPKRRRFSWRG